MNYLFLLENISIDRVAKLGRGKSEYQISGSKNGIQGYLNYGWFTVTYIKINVKMVYRIFAGQKIGQNGVDFRVPKTKYL